LFILVSFWPIAQISRHGSDYLQVAFVKEIFKRFSPLTANESTGGFLSFFWLEWLMNDMVWLLPTALTSMLIVPFFPKLRSNIGVKILLIIAIFFFCLFTMAGGKIYSRYLIQVIPFMVVLVVIVAGHTFRPSFLLPMLGLVIVFATNSGLHNTDFLLHDKRSDVKKEIAHFAQELPNVEQAIFFLPGVPPGLTVYYANLDRSVVLVGSIRELRKKANNKLFKNPHRVLSPNSKLAEIKNMFGEIEVLDKRGDYMIWRHINDAKKE